MKKLLICKYKITYKKNNGEEIIENMSECGEQIYKENEICIIELNLDTFLSKSKMCLTDMETNKEHVFCFIDKIVRKTIDPVLQIDVAIEENYIYKKYYDGRKTKEHYFTVGYNVVDKSCGKSIANEFMVFNALDSYAFKRLLDKIQYEMKWNKIDKIQCETVPTKWIFSATAAGFFFHECIGHLLEEEQFNFFGLQVGDKLLNAPIDIFENWKSKYKIDDFDMPVMMDICLVRKGKIVNAISANMTKSSGNAYTQEPFVEPMARMNCMYVTSKEQINNIFFGVEEGIYFDEITSGEFNPINGEIGLSIVKASRVVNGELKEAYEPMTILFNIKDLLKNEIILDKNYDTVMSLCGKYGAVKKIIYKVPQMKIDWSENGKFIADRSF